MLEERPDHVFCAVFTVLGQIELDGLVEQAASAAVTEIDRVGHLGLKC